MNKQKTELIEECKNTGIGHFRSVVDDIMNDPTPRIIYTAQGRDYIMNILKNQTRE